MTTFDPPKKAYSANYPDPLVVAPMLTHKQTFIILHGRGSNAQSFGPPLLSSKLPDGRTLQTAFPHSKYVFPTASKRRAQIYNRSTIHQWFDNWSLSTPSEKEELIVDGLRETSSYIHGLITEAIREVGARNVVLGGLSQGCAATLIALLLWEGEPLAAGFGMCGWLPLRQHMADIVDPQTPRDNGEDPFAQADDRDQELDLPVKTVAWLREELDLPTPPAASVGQISPVSLAFQRTLLLLAHGIEDEKVKVELGHEARDTLVSLKIEVDWKEYEGLGHWYSTQMLGDLVNFLEDKAGWTGNLDRGTAIKSDLKEKEDNLEGGAN